MKYFQGHHAFVKLAALGLIMLLEWGRTAIYVGIPRGVALAFAKHVA